MAGEMMFFIEQDDGSVLSVDSPVEWETKSRWRKADRLIRNGQMCVISTVFLGISHGEDNGKPVLYETMVFGGPLSKECRRYTTKQDAIEGHKRVLDELKAMKWQSQHH